MNIDDLLVEEIKSELSELKGVEIGTQEHKMAVEDITKLMDRAIELDRLGHQDKEYELREKQYQLDLDKRNDAIELTTREYELKEKQYQLESSKRYDTKELTTREYELKTFLAEDEKRDRFVRNCISVANIAIPNVIMIWGVLKSFEFEREGTITTSVGRGFMTRLFPKK